MEKLTIDCHIHITPPEIIAQAKKYRKDEPYFDLLSSSPKNSYTTADELVRQMDRIGLEKAVVFGFSFQSMELCQKANDYTIEAVQRFPERLLGLATVNPLADNLTEELARCRAAGLRGVGELMATGQGVDLTDQEQLKPLCTFCREQDWPLLVHLNEPVGHYYPGKSRDSIKQGEVLAKNFPEVKFIYAHWGGGLIFYELMPELRADLQNVYYDTAASPFLYDRKIYRLIKEMGLTDKILLGSDYPLLSPAVYLEELAKTGLSGAEQELIRGGNARRLFKL